MARTQRFAELRNLRPEVQQEIDDRLTAGINAREIVKYLQDDCKVLTDKNPDSLKKMLERYRTSDLAEKNRARVLNATKGMSVSKLAKTLNAMHEINELCVIQRARVDKMLTMEQKQDNFVLKQTSEEIKLLKENLVELGKLQLETGVLKRASRTVTGTVVDADGNTTDFEWDEETKSLYDRLDNLEKGLVIDATALPGN
jgi:hypothetical protein